MQIFTNDTKHKQYIYIYQIRVHKTLVKNLGSIPQESTPFVQKWLESHSFTMEPHWKSCDSSGMMGMDRKFISREIKSRWNHEDPTAKLPESHWPSIGLLHNCRWSSIIQLRSFRRRRLGSPQTLYGGACRVLMLENGRMTTSHGCCWEKKEKKKGKRKKTYREGEKKELVASRKLIIP